MEKFGFQKAIIGLILLLVERLERHFEDFDDKIEKSSSLKVIVLILKPIEELIQIVGPSSELLPPDYRKRVQDQLDALKKKVLPMGRDQPAKIPYALLETYINVALLVDKDF